MSKGKKMGMESNVPKDLDTFYFQAQNSSRAVYLGQIKTCRGSQMILRIKLGKQFGQSSHN